jgi:SAM-dependent MidA family methyltransferase
MIDPPETTRHEVGILKDSAADMQPERHKALPKPDAAGAARSERTADYIRNRITAAGGAISFAEYMHHALYAPGVGYYSGASSQFGAGGDFVTAAEVSTLFGRILARQCAQAMNGIASPGLLEFGGGSGRLAADILRALAELDALPDRYLMLEVSPQLRARQRAYLADTVPELSGRVEWIDRLPDCHDGVIIANEVLDALPVERFVRRSGRLAQLCVAIAGDSFVLTLRDAPVFLVDAVANIEAELGHAIPDGYVTEACTAIPHWISELAAALHSGVVFLFDYGISRREYYGEERAGGWLRCHFRHHAHDDPLILPGIQDITSWVDFSAVAAAAVAGGLEIEGFVTQSQFLLAAGLDVELAGFTEMPIDAQLKLSAEVKLLTLPGGMGEHFKCLGLSRGLAARPSAFSGADRIASL